MEKFLTRSGGDKGKGRLEGGDVFYDNHEESFSGCGGE